jgi:NAD(P)-dependent dehydrogenase (short-subunit alcohol dehydrogenase family)
MSSPAFAPQDARPVALVTGATGGIGAATAGVLVEKGYMVVCTDIKPDTSESEAAHKIHWPHMFDVASEENVSDNVAAVEDRYGPIAALVNAAGILGKMHRPERLRMVDWDREVAVDLRGTYVVCRAVGSRMAERGRGAIVNIASVVGMTSGPVHGYGPAKAAVINLTMTLAAEWGPKGVRVNAVSPGFTVTPALEAAFEHGALSRDALTSGAALRRLVDPTEIGFAAAWLLGPESRAVTGINLPVDAGFLAGVTWQAYGGLRP